jgi:hypothetical protein
MGYGQHKRVAFEEKVWIISMLSEWFGATEMINCTTACHDYDSEQRW